MVRCLWGGKGPQSGHQGVGVVRKPQQYKDFLVHLIGGVRGEGGRDHVRACATFVL